MKLLKSLCWGAEGADEPLSPSTAECGAALREESEMLAHNGGAAGAAPPADEEADEEGAAGRLAADALALDVSRPGRRGGRRASRKEWRKRKVLPIGSVLLLVSGAANVLVGALSLVWTPLDLMLEERLRMTPGLPAFDWWVTPPDAALAVFIFNVTNSERFLRGEDSILQFQEVGPVVFRDKIQHQNVTFNTNGTMTYTTRRYLEMNWNETQVDLNATLIVPSLSLLGMCSFLHDASFFTKIGLTVLYRRLRAKPFTHVSVYNYLWNYSDPLLHVAGKLAPFLVPVDNLGVMKITFQNLDEQMTVHMGPGSSSRFFTMSHFLGSPRLNHWRDPVCDAVEGATEGIFYHQGVRRNDSLQYFRNPVCRLAPLQYTGDLVKDGIPAYRFELPDDFYDRTADPSTDCYAGDQTEPLLSGLGDVSPCFYNFPVAASAPHFLNGDPWLIDSVGGMNPQREKHGSYVIVEPITGIPMEGYSRLQSNLVIRKLSGLTKDVERFSNMTIPLFWVDNYQSGLPWYVYYLLYFVINILPDLQSWLSFIMLTCGSGMFIGGLSSIICTKKKSPVHSHKFFHLISSTASSTS